jgi:DNA-binding response OmpR family regulator
MPGRILLVEDNPGLRDVTTNVLEGHGFEVFGAASGSEALAIAAARQIDAAIIDLHLPDMNGAQLAKALSPLPIAILSGDSSIESVPGASAFLHKPLHAAELFAALEILLAKK